MTEMLQVLYGENQKEIFQRRKETLTRRLEAARAVTRNVVQYCLKGTAMYRFKSCCQEACISVNAMQQRLHKGKAWKHSQHPNSRMFAVRCSHLYVP